MNNILAKAIEHLQTNHLLTDEMDKAVMNHIESLESQLQKAKEREKISFEGYKKDLNSLMKIVQAADELAKTVKTKMTYQINDAIAAYEKARRR